MNEEATPGDIATLHRPYMGYRRIELVEKLQYIGVVRKGRKGKEYEVWKEEFELD